MLLNISVLQSKLCVFVFLQICICETASVRQLKQASLRSLTRSFANAKLLPFGVLQFYHFQIFKVFPFYRKAHQCAYLLPALYAGCSGVDVQKGEVFVIEHFQDMAVAADEKVGRVLHELLPNANGVPSGIASDMRHHNVSLFALPS